MKILLAILVLLALGQVMSCEVLDGCDRNNDLVVISFKAKQWLPYEQGDKLVFGNDATTDTVLVTYLEDVESFINGAECPEGTMETIRVRMTSNLFEDSIKFKIEDRTTVLLENESIALEFDDSNTSFLGKDFSPAYHATLTRASHTYTEALVSTCDTCEDLKEIVFARNQGLVAFKTKTDYWFKE